jgi:hypothetical protein
MIEELVAAALRLALGCGFVIGVVVTALAFWIF